MKISVLTMSRRMPRIETFSRALIVGLWLLTAGACSEAYTDSQGLPHVASQTRLAWQFVYDDGGRFKELTDPGGRRTRIHYEHDDEHRLLRLTKEFPSGAKGTFDFDRFGRRTAMTDGAGTVRYEYDGFHRLTGVRREGSRAIVYTYDTLNRLNSVSLDTQTITRYSYDFLGRLARMDTPVGNISYEYQSAQRMIIRTLPNGIRSFREFRPDGRLDSITHVAKDDHILAKLTYAYRPDDLIQEIEEWFPEGEKIQKYEYDTAYRLVRFTDSQKGQFRYRYDNLGYLIGFSAPGQDGIESAFDWAGRLVRYNGENSVYDIVGNIAGYTREQGKVGFTYTPEQALETVQTDQTTVRYGYDGDGRLISRSLGLAKTEFIPDPLSDVWRPLFATHANGGHELYIWDGAVPIATITGGEARFFLHDYLDSVRLVADRDGRIIQRSDYTPFGAPLSPANHSAAGGGLHPAFAGWFLDPTPALYLTGEGAYDPRLGRRLQHALPTQAAISPSLGGTLSEGEIRAKPHPFRNDN